MDDWTFLAQHKRKPEIPVANLDSIFKSRDITLLTKVRLATTSTGSLASQMHPGKFPKVPGRRRGKREGELGVALESLQGKGDLI